MLDMAECEGVVDIYNCVKTLCSRRVNMIQTEVGGHCLPSLPAPGFGSFGEEFRADGVCQRGVLRAEIPELGLPTSEGLPKVSSSVFGWVESNSQGATVIGFAGKIRWYLYPH